MIRTAALIALLALPVLSQEPAHPGAHWSYGDETGPSRWAALAPDYRVCGVGRAQSPIDLTPGRGADLPELDLVLPQGAAVALDTGHTLQVTPAAGAGMAVAGVRFNLVQFHFHAPSEHRIREAGAAMEAHFVHRAADGRLAVLAVLIEEGQSNPALAALVAGLPAGRGAVRAFAPGEVPVAALVPADRRYLRYDGSLTTPPCTEGVLWHVLVQPVTALPAEIAAYAARFPGSARPLQPAHDRVVVEDTVD